MIPVLEWRIAGSELSYRWADVVDGFHMPIRISLGGGTEVRLVPSQTWQSMGIPAGVTALKVDHGYYVATRRLEDGAR